MFSIILVGPWIIIIITFTFIPNAPEKHVNAAEAITVNEFACSIYLSFSIVFSIIIINNSAKMIPHVCIVIYLLHRIQARASIFHKK